MSMSISISISTSNIYIYIYICIYIFILYLYLYLYLYASPPMNYVLRPLQGPNTDRAQGKTLHRSNKNQPLVAKHRTGSKNKKKQSRGNLWGQLRHKFLWDCFFGLFLTCAVFDHKVLFFWLDLCSVWQ